MTCCFARSNLSTSNFALSRYCSPMSGSGGNTPSFFRTYPRGWSGHHVPYPWKVNMQQGTRIAYRSGVALSRLHAATHRRKSHVPMLTAPLTPERLTSSVLAVPPLARNADCSINDAENAKIIRHIEAGGIRTLLYGGNANFYHIPLGDYDHVLRMLAGAAG